MYSPHSGVIFHHPHNFIGGVCMSSTGSYKARQFNLSGLKGISDQTLEMHFKLYEGYVKETNKLTERITEFIKDGNVDQEEMPAYSELTRRLGFEYNGMVLHEYYFDNLQKGGGTGDPESTSSFAKAAACLLYTSDAADERSSVDLGGRRIIKK